MEGSAFLSKLVDQKDTHGHVQTAKRQATNSQTWLWKTVVLKTTLLETAATNHPTGIRFLGPSQGWVTGSWAWLKPSLKAATYADLSSANGRGSKMGAQNELPRQMETMDDSTCGPYPGGSVLTHTHII